MAGFHQDSTNTSFINAGNTDMTSGADVAEVAVHETTHHILNEQDNGYTDEQKERAATADGDYARELWEQGVKYGDLASPAPAATAQPNNAGGNDGKADWLAAQQGSDRALLDQNTATAADVPSSEREELLQLLLVPEAVPIVGGILAGVGVSLGLMTPEPDETGSGVMGHPAADMDVTGGFSTGGSPVADIDTPSTETELRPEQGPTIYTTPAANGDEVSPNSGGYVGKDVTLDDLLMMAEGLDEDSKIREVHDLFDKNHPRKEIQVGNQTLHLDQTNSGRAKIFDGASEAEVKSYFEELTGGTLPEPVVSEKGIRYTISTPHGNFNLRSYSSSAGQTKADWSIDIPKEAINANKNGELKFRVEE